MTCQLSVSISCAFHCAIVQFESAEVKLVVSCEVITYDWQANLRPTAIRDAAKLYVVVELYVHRSHVNDTLENSRFGQTRTHRARAKVVTISQARHSDVHNGRTDCCRLTSIHPV